LLEHLFDQNGNRTAIDARLGMSRRLIYHLIETGQLDRDLAASPPHRARIPAAI